MDEDINDTLQYGTVDLAIIGCGTLGTDILLNILSENPTSPIRFISVTVSSDASAERLRQKVQQELRSRQSNRSAITVTTDNLDAVKDSDLILLACKPYQVADILGNTSMREALAGKCIISVVAGWSSKKLFDLVSHNDVSGSLNSTSKNKCSVIRTNPNIAAAAGSSMTTIEQPAPTMPWAVSAKYLAFTKHIFNLCGAFRLLPASQFEAGSALAGMGPAFLSVAVDGLLDGAVFEGVKRNEGKAIVAGALRGLAALIEQGEEMGSVRERTASPAGTTIRGLVALERAGVRIGFTDAVVKGVERAREIEGIGKT